MSRYVFLVILSFFIRLLFFNIFLKNNPIQTKFDSGHYYKIAMNFSQGNGFVHQDGSPQFYRLPVYPMFLAGCYWLCEHLTPIFEVNCPNIVPLLIQLFLSSLIPLLIFFLAKVIFVSSCTAATYASFLAVIHPGLLVFSGLIMSETLFIFFFLLFLILFFSLISFFVKSPPLIPRYTCFADTRDIRDIKLLLAGAVLGIASLIRPAGHILWFLSALILLVSKLNWQKKIVSFFSFSFGWLAIVGIWLLRNWLLTGYIFFHTLSGPHFLNHAAIRLTMKNNNYSYQQAKNVVYKQFEETIQNREFLKKKQLIEIEKSFVAEEITKKIMFQNFITTTKFFIENITKTFFSLYSSELLCIDSHGNLPSYSSKRTLKEMLLRFLFPTVKNKLIIIFIYFEIIFFLFLITGFMLFLWQILTFKISHSLLVIFPFIAIFPILSLVCGFARLRLPIEPLILLCATHAYIKIISRK
jgi:hypothetical protein